MEITPEMANDWLLRNPINRPLNLGWIDDLRREMDLGRWKLNGQTICITDKDEILDGQHRLTACVLSDSSFMSFVIFGLPREVFDTIDVGRKRTPAEALRMLGHKNTIKLASALATIERINTGKARKNVHYGIIDIEELVNKYPGVDQSVHLCMGCSLVAPSLMSAMHYLFSQKDPDAADEFFAQLSEGYGLGRGDPVCLLRDKMLNNKTARAKLPRGIVTAFIIKAWNARRAGRKMKTLRFQDHGKGSEVFPEIK